MALDKILWIGLLGSFLMFLGDMTLYYDPQDYDSRDTINSIIGIMKKVPIKRLYLGGILGPLCAFIYCIGFYHIVLACQDNHVTLGWIVFLVNILGMVLGGAYHIQCAYLGLLSRHQSQGAMDEFLKFLKFQAKISFGIMAVGNLGLTLMVLLGLTIFPRWQVLLTPLVLLVLTPLAGKLPKGLHMIIRGGWLNLIYFIYYLSLLVYLGL